MPIEPLHHLCGQPAAALTVNVGCPKCEGLLTIVNGTRRTFEQVGHALFLVLQCKRCRTHYEVSMNLVRSDIRQVKLSGAQQRAERLERMGREMASTR